MTIESRFDVPRIVQPHSAPGTGKTALAQHVAKALQRPLMRRQTSDIANKCVGETEQNMARMVEEPSTEGAVLLRDEADCFLRSRRLAEHNCEITEVNKMLQPAQRVRMFIAEALGGGGQICGCASAGGNPGRDVVARRIPVPELHALMPIGQSGLTLF